MVGQLAGGDVQTFVDTIDGVSPPHFHVQGAGRPILIRISTFCQLDIRRPRTGDPQELSTLFTQDLWRPSPTSNITEDSALLRPSRQPGEPQWIFGRVERSV